MNDDYIISAKNLKKIYKSLAEDVVAINGISFDIKEGEFVSVMGYSGSGKTTLLNMLGCLDSLTSGDLYILGKNVKGFKEKDLFLIRRNNISFVFQEFLLIPTLTALENVELVMHFTDIKFDRQKALKLLKDVGLGHRLNHLPSQLSGGEIQRVAIARSLITNPRIIIADEPTGHLDTKNAANIFDIFREFNTKGITVIVASHNAKLGNEADRVIYLEDGNIVKNN